MRHLVLTRLALDNPDEEWLKSRIKIFEEFCAPSVALQSCSDFIWLLALGHKTPNWFAYRVEEIAPFAKLVYSDSLNIYPAWQQLVPKELISPVLLTTRFDSDDALHKNFVTEVQKAARSQKQSCALDAPLGYKLNLLTMECCELRCPSNHFVSLIEFGTHQTAFCCSHLEMSSKFPVKTFAEHEPLWVEGFHGGNVINKAQQYGKPVDWSDVKKDF